MATLLEKYTDLRTGLVEKVMNGVLPLDKVLVYQEILYRIDVLESCQLFVKTAPVTTDTKVLAYHYQMWDVYIYHKQRASSPAWRQKCSSLPAR